VQDGRVTYISATATIRRGASGPAAPEDVIPAVVEDLLGAH